MSVFTQKLNPLAGTIEWEQQDEDYDYYQEIARSAFADMLHDTERNQKYFKALEDAIKKFHARGEKANVLDIGTGTGLLSLMAVKCGADSVVACEAFRPMAQCALKIIKENHSEHDIKIIPKRSTDLTVGENGDLKQRANILVTEVFDTELIGEGAISTFTHAHRELLNKDCIVIPSSGTIFAQIVESPLAQNWNKLKLIANSDGDVLLRTPEDIVNCAGAAAVHDIQLSQFPIHAFNAISDVIPVMSFDWSGKTQLKYSNCFKNNVKVKQDGNAQMIFMWWELNMDTENRILLSCAPYWAHPDLPRLVAEAPNLEFQQDLIPWRDHWMQAVYYLPKEVSLRKDEEICLISSHDEYSLWFNVKSNTPDQHADYLAPTCSCGFHVANSRTRIGQINDGTRNKKYLNVMEKFITPETVCLTISDGSMVSLAAAKIGAKHVFCLERNTIFVKILKNYIDFNKLQNKVTIIQNFNELKISDLNKINFIFAEPYFVTSLLPWDNCYFGNLLSEIKEHLPKDVVIIPNKASIKALAVEFLDLHKIRAPIGDCEGFIMDKFDKLIQKASKRSDNPVEPQPLWEYPCKALSNTMDLITFDFNKLLLEDSSEVNGKISLDGSGTCNGVAMWVDWNLDENRKNVITTGPIFEPEINKRITWDMHTRQGVYLMPKAKVHLPNTKLTYKAIYNKPEQYMSFTFKKDLS